jgi:7,8-dihydropterin-6-yl-methyl-4-(beta-D-ribofuranosyl)aminobenzene 5'-phosphate synthase
MIRITTLVENTPGEHLALRHEHGISFFIEVSGRHLLFDTGQAGTFLENAKKLRLDPASLEYVVLSHGHYDHSGGFRFLADVPGSRRLVVGPGFFEDKYAVRNGGYEFLGNDFTRDFLEARGIPYTELSEPTLEIVPGVFVLGSFLRLHKDETINPRFLLFREGRFVPDPFDDEVMIAIDTPEGIIALLGCSHPGMRNMLDAAKSRLGKPIRVVLGGTHLVEAAEPGLSASLDYLTGGNIKVVGVSHCTGSGAMKRLEGTGTTYFHNRTGSSLVIPD